MRNEGAGYAAHNHTPAGEGWGLGSHEGWDLLNREGWDD